MKLPKPNRYNISGMLILVAGLILIGWHTSWWVSLGVWVALAGNQIDVNAKRLESNRLLRKTFK